MVHIFVLGNLDNTQIIEKLLFKVHAIVEFSCGTYGTFKQIFRIILIRENR